MAEPPAGAGLRWPSRERYGRARDVLLKMDAEGFGYCTKHAEHEDACPELIRIETIPRMNRDYRIATLWRPAE
jgi:succinate dehydrogenase / fumarate reductase iron-sulfur subunit